MRILLWLAVPATCTALAMVWAAWSGRPRRDPADRRDDPAAQARLAAAVTKPLPTQARRVVSQPVDRVSGVARKRPAKAGPRSPSSR
ncbi:MAG: hypothetical protein ACRDP1_15905 [Nocardioidaceae bacterium]